MSDPVVENVVRHNGPNVPQHVVAESISQGTMGSVRDVAWFWEKSDAQEYVKLLAEARAHKAAQDG